MAGLSEEFKLDFKFGGNVEFITRLEALMKRIDEKFDSVEESISETADATDEMVDSVHDLNKELNTGIDTLQSFGDRLKDIVKYYISFSAARAGAERVWNFGRESMEAYSTQERAENQLKGVLRNRGSLSQFQAIKDYAAEIQRNSVYGDEAMIKGAGELATYVKGTESLKSMMKLLTDYAAGMTGGGEVSPDQMESLATGLGMAYDGNYMAMRRKGFDTSKLEALDAILETGGRWGAKEKKKYGDVLDEDTLAQIRKNGGVTEQMRVDALRESLGDWEHLSDTVNDLSSSAIVKFNNKLGDLKENLGKRIYPVFNRLVKTIDDNMPQIESFFGYIGEIFESMVTAISENITDIIAFGKNLMGIVTSFAKGAFYTASLTNKFIGFRQAIIALVGAMAVGRVWEFVKAMKIAMATMAGAEGANAAGGLAGAFGKLSSAMNTTAGKMVLLGGSLWGLQKVGEFVSTAIDLVNEKLRESRRNEGLNEYKHATNEQMSWKRSMDEFAAKMTPEERKMMDKMPSIPWNPGWNPAAGNGFDMRSVPAGASRRLIDWAVARGAYEYYGGQRKQASAKMNRNSSIPLKNPMDGVMNDARAAEKAINDMAKDSKGNVTMYNQYQNTNIEQNVEVSTDMQKIGILLNQNIRSIIEKQLRQNREIGMGQA